MDDQMFQALMGSVPADGSQDQSAIVRQLRDQNEMGGLYQFSPTLQGQGEAMQKGALSSAKQIGDRRKEGLTRTRQAEQDKFSKEKHDQTLKGYRDVKQYKNDAGEMETWGENKRTGKYEQVPEMEGLTPYDKYANRKGGAGAQGWRSGNLASGAKINTNLLTGEIEAFGEIFDDVAAFNAKYPDERLSDETTAKRELARGTSFGTESGKRDEERIETAFEAADASETLSDDYGQMIKLLDEGAKTGVLYDVLPSFTAATKAFESYADKLTLNNLKKWKLTPVSDKDIKYLKSASLANVPPEEMRNYLVYQQEASQRIAAGEAIMADYLERNNGRRPRGEDAKALQDEIHAVVYAPGFTWPSQGGGPMAAMLPGEPEVAPEITPGVDKESGVTTLTDGTKWDAQGNQIQ